MRSNAELLAASISLGSFGSLLKYIDDNLPASSPHISIPAALSILSTLKSGRLYLHRPTHPSLFTCVIAESGTGKTDSHKLVKKILESAGLLKKIVQGVPGTDSGLQKSLNANPRQLVIWDELGMALSALAKSQNNHMANVLSMMMELYSAAGTKFIGKQYATIDRIDVDKPFLNVLGASTSIRFFGALNEDWVHDGYLSRWLIFFQDAPSIDRNPEFSEPPSEVLEYLEKLDDWIPATSGGNLRIAMGQESLTLRFTPEAKAMHDRSFREFKNFQRKAKNPISQIFWSRAYENYCKVLLTIAEFDTATIDHVLWASDLVETCILQVIKRCQEKLRPADREGVKDKLLNAIDGEWVAKRDLTRKTYRLNLSKLERESLINDFIESGLWESQERKISEWTRAATFYKRV